MAIYRDNIYGMIKLEPYATLIINTPQFTRLRHLSQLGTMRYIYSSAIHTRYEHSIGVYHLTLLLLDVVYPETKDNAHKLRKLVCIAALCHDLGHGPFSHLFESLIAEHYPNAPLHEERSGIILRDLLRNIEEHHPAEYKEHLNLSAPEIDAICALINGEIPNDEEFRTREYLCRIVSNPICGIDTDRLDYLLRDSKALGIGITIRPIELLKSVELRSIRPKFLDLPDDQVPSRCVICYPTRLSFDVSQIFHMRYSLFKMAYNSPSTLSADVLIKDILYTAEREGILNLSWIDHNPLEICKIDDRLIYSIKQRVSETPPEAHIKLKNLLYRLESNDFYVNLFSHSFPAGTHSHPLGDPSLKCSQKVEFIRYLFSTIGADCDMDSDLIIDAHDLHHGQHAIDPNKYVPYYNGDFTDITDELMEKLFSMFPSHLHTTGTSVVLRSTEGAQSLHSNNQSKQLDRNMEVLHIEQNFVVDQRTQDLLDVDLDIRGSDAVMYPFLPIKKGSHEEHVSIDNLIEDYKDKLHRSSLDTAEEIKIDEDGSKQLYEAGGMLSAASYQETMISIYMRPSKHVSNSIQLHEKYLRQILTVFGTYMHVYGIRFNILRAIPGEYTKLFTDPYQKSNFKSASNHGLGSQGMQDRIKSTPPGTKDSAAHPFSLDNSIDSSQDATPVITEPHVKSLA